jgi:hypothetical protein
VVVRVHQTVTKTEAQAVTPAFARDSPGALDLAYSFRENAAEPYGPQAAEVLGHYEASFHPTGSDRQQSESNCEGIEYNRENGRRKQSAGTWETHRIIAKKYQGAHAECLACSGIKNRDLGSGRTEEGAGFQET